MMLSVCSQAAPVGCGWQHWNIAYTGDPMELEDSNHQWGKCICYTVVPLPQSPPQVPDKSGPIRGVTSTTLALFKALSTKLTSIHNTWSWPAEGAVRPQKAMYVNGSGHRLKSRMSSIQWNFCLVISHLQHISTANYFDREVKRRGFVVQRWDFREKEKMELEAEHKRKAGVGT